MSIVTNVLLLTTNYDRGDEAVRQLNAWLVEKSFHHQPMTALTDSIGGGKAMEAVVYAGAFDRLSLESFIAEVRTLDWGDDRRATQLLVKRQDDNVFVDMLDENWRADS